jgi:hypothetical protein
MKIIIATALVFLFQHASAQHTNIMISNANSPEEPSIMISPKNPKYIVAGANIRSVYYSSDTGRTWTSQLLSSSFGVYGDPAIIADTAGSFYFFHLSDPPGTAFLDQIVCQKSTNQGVTWSNGASIGFNSAKEQDKQWGAVDARNNNIYVTWTEFDNYGSPSPADSSHILFSRSTDGGISWTPALRLDQRGGDCIDDDNTVEGAVPSVGPNGEVYVAWAGPLGLVFDKSLDAGNTWMANDKIVTAIPGGWSFDISGIYRANGLPVTVCDTSHGTHRGNIYINWTDQRNGGTDTDVWLVKSGDGGNTWTAPVRVNNDVAGKQQFFTWMSIDQSNGYLYFVYYDRRAYPDDQTDVYMARSIDGGLTFQNFKVSNSPFVPASGIFFGDYTNLSVIRGIIRPVWTRLDAGQLSVWTALVDSTLIPGVVTGINAPDNTVENIYAYPNPFTNNSFISFKLRRSGVVSVDIFDVSGKMVSSPIREKRYPAGKFIERIDSKATHLAPGTYFYRILINNQLYTQKMLLIE